MFVDFSFTRNRVSYRIDFQESTSIEMCLSTSTLAMGAHVTMLWYDEREINSAFMLQSLLTLATSKETEKIRLIQSLRHGN
jgi:hypothetical protein